MSLVYLVTGLPDLKWREPPPISDKEFLKRALSSLMGKSLRELELLWWHYEIFQTTNIRSTTKACEPNLDNETIQRRILHDRADSVEGHELALPVWVTENEPHQILMRKWYQEVCEHANSKFLKHLAPILLGIDEALVGLTCKSLGDSKQTYLLERLGNFDPAADAMDRNYDKSDMGLGASFSWFPSLLSIAENPDAHSRENLLNKLKWDLIQREKPLDFFTIDFAVAYYFELQILAREKAFSKKHGTAFFQSILNDSIEETLSC